MQADHRPPAPGQPVSHFNPGPSPLHLALVVVLNWALAVGAVALLNRLDGNGPWRFMPLFALVVALESVLTRRWLESPGTKRLHRFYGPAELVVLLALAPLFLWLSAGRLPFPTTLAQALEDPFALFSLPLILYMLLAALVWFQAHRWANWFVQLAITPDEIKFHTSTPSQRSSDWSIVLPIKDRLGLLNAFVRSWITGGILLVIASALASVDLGELSASLSGELSLRTVTRLGLGQDTLLALLVYFLAGLWLISQGRAVVLKARWLASASQSDPEIVARWHRWALLVIGALALLALFLPIGTTYPLFQFIQAVGRFLSAIASAILAVFGWLIYFLASRFRGGEAPEQPPVSPSEFLQRNPPPADTLTGAPSLFAGSLFWLALIALAIVATLYVTSDRGPNLTLDQLAGFWRRLLRWLLGLGQEGAARAAMLARPIRSRLRRPSLAGKSRSPFRLPRIGALPPKEQVRFLYLSLVRHAGKQGLPRSPAATPIEFSADLKASWPEVSPDVERLTGAFMAARYGTGEIDRGQLGLAKEAWLRIRRRGRRRPDPGSTESPVA